MGHNVLHSAAMNGSVELVKLLISKGDLTFLNSLTVTSTGKTGVTALRIAAECDHGEVVRVLLHAGVDANLCDDVSSINCIPIMERVK